MIDDFAPDGLLAKTLKDFVPREQQQKMATEIRQAILDEKNLIIEAGTGTGKTFAYLVPAFRSNKKVKI